MTEQIRLLVANDYPVVRLGFRSMLASFDDIEVVGEACDGASALRFVADLVPDVVLLDVQLSGGDSAYLIPRLHSAAPNARVLVIMTYNDAAQLSVALRAGAAGFLLKTASGQELAEAIRGVYRGRHVLSEALVDTLVRQFAALARDHTHRRSGLTPSELEILTLVANGASTLEIAQTQHWSEITVKRKITGILAKLSANTRAHAVAEAMRRGLI